MSIIGYTPRLALPIYDHWKNAPWEHDRWPNFGPHEFACKGTGRLAYDPETMDLLQDLRDQVGPMFIVSGYRHPSHNAHVGGAEHSFHMDGIATDVSMVNHDKELFIRLAERLGFDGIGRYSTFTHIDTRGYRARW